MYAAKRAKFVDRASYAKRKLEHHWQEDWTYRADVNKYGSILVHKYPRSDLFDTYMRDNPRSASKDRDEYMAEFESEYRTHMDYHAGLHESAYMLAMLAHEGDTLMDMPDSSEEKHAEMMNQPITNEVLADYPPVNKDRLALIKAMPMFEVKALAKELMINSFLPPDLVRGKNIRERLYMFMDVR